MHVPAEPTIGAAGDPVSTWTETSEHQYGSAPQPSRRGSEPFVGWQFLEGQLIHELADLVSDPRELSVVLPAWPVRRGSPAGST
jgi:hypothetical protein